MKKIAAFIILATTSIFGLRAQDIRVPDGYHLVDSVVFRPMATLDSTLVDANVFNVLGSNEASVNIRQSDKIKAGMSQHIIDNRKATISGYRVRIYFDNKQDARGASESAQRRFESSHPGITAYRSFVNPFFKVTVGDFRTRSEAIELLHQISSEFPTAFVVKENINYPVVDKENSYYLDTLHLVRPIEPDLTSF